MADSSDIKEGFICPTCHKDLKSPSNLLSHFESQHSEEQDILSSLKELVGKAKKKILKIDDQAIEQINRELKEYYLVESEPQDPGHVTFHTNFFKQLRRERLDHKTAETNKLIIRLDRLIRIHGTDRKQEEQRIVTWLDGTSVTRCPSCAASFNLTRRQHHCRLCGSIMCNSCSCFLPYETARSIIVPVNLDSSGSPQHDSHKSDSDSIRICSHCMDMLACRKFVQMNQVKQSSIYVLYEHLQKIKGELQPSVDLYHNMIQMLNAGDTTYQLQDAQLLKSSIAKQTESLDFISKKIAALPPETNPPNEKIIHLQNAIRRATSNYIKDNLLTLPVLPTPAELEVNTKKRLEKKREQSTNIISTVNIKKVTTGWSPASISSGVGPDIDQDPLIQQIKIVENYITQAQKANRFDEVRSLRTNLEMLQQSYREKYHTRSDV